VSPANLLNSLQKRRGFVLRRINRRREWANNWQQWAMEARVSHAEGMMADGGGVRWSPRVAFTR
jgi:hypothetical protein